MTSLADYWRSLPWVPDRRPIWEWASENVQLPSGLSLSGFFNVRGSRHFILPLEWLQSDHVREVNICANARGGKTLIADVTVPWFRANDPASILWVFQDEKIAEQHAEERQWPILLRVPAVVPMLPRNQHKQRKSDILFADGLPLILTGPAISGLQSKGFRFVICDEPWLYKKGILGEARGRLGDFLKMDLSKFLCISQGGEDESDWETQLNNGAMHDWHVMCSHCGHYMPLKWSAYRPDGTKWGMVFDLEKDERGEYNVDKAINTVRYVCRECGHEHPDTEHTRSQWNISGKYVLVGQDNPRHKSAHWNAILDWKWRDLVLLWISARRDAAKGDHGATIQFAQKYLAEFRSERTAHLDSQPFAREAIEVQDKTPEGWLRFLTVDRQLDEYWWTVREWQTDQTGRSRRIGFGRAYSIDDIDAKANEFGITRLTLGAGREAINVRLVFIDSGYEAKGDAGVYAACAKYGWIALKGADEPYFWHTIRGERVQRIYDQRKMADPGYGTKEANRRLIPLIRFSAQAAADCVQGLIDRALWIEPTDTDDALEREYKTQMSAEFKKKKLNKFSGKEELVWVCPSRNNHAWDCAKMQAIAAKIRGIL